MMNIENNGDLTQRVITGISHLFKLGCIYVIVLLYCNFKE
jgi:hypothetical protein